METVWKVQQPTQNRAGPAEQVKGPGQPWRGRRNITLIGVAPGGDKMQPKMIEKGKRADEVEDL
jgi:hypothetical protein